MYNFQSQGILRLVALDLLKPNSLTDFMAKKNQNLYSTHEILHSPDLLLFTRFVDAL